MAIARRLDSLVRAPRPDPLGGGAGGPRARLPGRIRGLLRDPGSRQRLALVAAPAGASSSGDRGGRSAPDRVRRRAPLPGADRCPRRRPRHARGLVPAADVAAGLQPGGARRSQFFDAVLEPGELAEREDRGPTVARRDEAHRVGPIVFCEEGGAGAARRRRARAGPGAGQGQRPGPARSGPGGRQRGEAMPGPSGGAWRRPGGGALLDDRKASRGARRDRAPALHLSDEPLLRRLRSGGLGRRLQRLSRADPVRGAGPVRADAPPDRRPGCARPLRRTGRHRAGDRWPGLRSARGAARRAARSGAARLDARAPGRAALRDGAAEAARWLGELARAEGGEGRGGSGRWRRWLRQPLGSARRAAPFAARLPLHFAAFVKQTIVRRPPRTVVLALGVPEGALERELEGALARTPTRPGACW